MTNQDKHILQLLKALDNFGQTFSEAWLQDIKKHRDWLEKDIQKRERANAESLQKELFK